MVGEMFQTKEKCEQFRTKDVFINKTINARISHASLKVEISKQVV